MNKKDPAGKIWFCPSVPEEVVTLCEPLFFKYSFLIPDWCKHVRIYWDADGKSTHVDEELPSASYVEVNYPYRTASVYICPHFLTEGKKEQDLVIAHELWHIVSLPLVDHIKKLAETIAKDDEVLIKVLEQTINEKSEALTEDLTNILSKVLETK